ncbi:HNH endonuclease [Neptuniibacter sp. QD37_6]|uniref:HNH endonuclease n=1 Tax=Neptuniibacter sp. QD37_6 TaxID=3398210 RepID=UPI0039F5179D
MTKNNIFIFTAGNPAARAHLSDSITNPIALNTIQDSVTSSELETLKSIEKEYDGLFAWGAVPGERNVPNWEELQPGDTVLTVYDNHYRFISKVLYKTRNNDAAKKIWGTDPSGQTWELMYFLTPPQVLDPAVPIETGTFSEYLNKAYRGFAKIGSEKIERIITEYGSIDHFFDKALSIRLPTKTEAEILLTEVVMDIEGSYDPTDHTDARDKILKSISQRQGQPKFRKALLEAYKGHCAVTGYGVEQTLEAAHIQPYKGKHTNHVQNGILLRSDIHSLFDKDLLTIDPDSWSIHLHPSITESEYSSLHGNKIKLPTEQTHYPSSEALQIRNRELDWFTPK